MGSSRLPRLESPRLELRPLTAQDTRPLHELWTQPGVRRYLWDDEVISRARVQETVEQNERLFQDQGCGLWGARLRGRNSLAGFGGFWYFHEPPRLELLYGVSEQLWGQGLATELATRVLEYSFAELGFSSIRASTDAGNQASVRVLEKLGFAFERRQVVDGLDTLFFLLPATKA